MKRQRYGPPFPTHDARRSGIFAEPSVHAAVIAPLQGDVDAVVGDMVACFTRIASLLEARSRNRRSNMQASAAQSSYVNSLLVGQLTVSSTRSHLGPNDQPNSSSCKLRPIDCMYRRLLLSAVPCLRENGSAGAQGTPVAHQHVHRTSQGRNRGDWHLHG
jgi:hypothetical protein